MGGFYEDFACDAGHCTLWGLILFAAVRAHAADGTGCRSDHLDGIDGGSGVCQLGQGSSPCIGAHDTGAAFVP